MGQKWGEKEVGGNGWMMEGRMMRDDEKKRRFYIIRHRVFHSALCCGVLKCRILTWTWKTIHVMIHKSNPYTQNIKEI